jgi:anaerobic selenocysteine-containing dehydrogenase
MNGLIREVLDHGWIDDDYVAAHTVNIDELRAVVDRWTPEAVARVCAVPADDIRRAAELFGTSSAVLSTVLQGFYQSHQATAAACQVNNLHLLRGMLGRPGCGVLQMNGQPTAQNTRECGADGDLPGFRNWDNPEHISELARLWNVHPMVIPHWAPPTHAMQIFRYAEQGSIRLLWVSGTNPAVSMPELPRIRRILGSAEVFLIVQDLYLTETARYADVVLPAAGWGEKTGTFTNADRTVHLSEQAVQPPGAARSDLDIFLDYAHRMGFRDKDGHPLLPWSGPEEVFRAWQECSRGRPCDYTGISYQRLRGGSGIQWPCNETYPDGTVRLYQEAIFPTDPDYCEDYGHDLLTGASVDPIEYRATARAGRAFLKAAHYRPAAEEPDAEYPLELTTGRTAYQFHTRTKTARATALNQAAPGPWVEISPVDAGPLGLAEGDIAEVRSRRGCITVPVRIGDIRPGTVFAPFHYGYFDTPRPLDAGGERGAANELTLTQWDPVSKQPGFKNAAVAIRKVMAGTAPAPAPTTTASRPAAGSTVLPTVGGPAGDATSMLPDTATRSVTER